jgi:hypothetical protein
VAVAESAMSVICLWDEAQLDCFDLSYFARKISRKHSKTPKK